MKPIVIQPTSSRETADKVGMQLPADYDRFPKLRAEITSEVGLPPRPPPSAPFPTGSVDSPNNLYPNLTPCSKPSHVIHHRAVPPSAPALQHSESLSFIFLTPGESSGTSAGEKGAPWGSSPRIYYCNYKNISNAKDIYNRPSPAPCKSPTAGYASQTQMPSECSAAASYYRPQESLVRQGAAAVRCALVGPPMMSSSSLTNLDSEVSSSVSLAESTSVTKRFGCTPDIDQNTRAPSKTSSEKATDIGPGSVWSNIRLVSSEAQKHGPTYLASHDQTQQLVSTLAGGHSTPSREIRPSTAITIEEQLETNVHSNDDDLGSTEVVCAKKWKVRADGTIVPAGTERTRHKKALKRKQPKTKRKSATEKLPSAKTSRPVEPIDQRGNLW